MTIINLIFSIAREGARPLGHTSVQFMIVRQRNSVDRRPGQYLYAQAATSQKHRPDSNRHFLGSRHRLIHALRLGRCVTAQ